MGAPLADKLRPKKLDDVVGQSHLLGEGKPLRRVIESKKIPNMIFYGPSGVGKTTVARIIADASGKRLHKLNGTSTSVADIKEIVAETKTFHGVDGILLYLDEIQYLNKKQQQSLLEYIETGDITLIASTTENPYFYIYNAILSRATIFEFKPIEALDIEKSISRGVEFLEEENGVKYEISEESIAFIAKNSGGDVRKALNSLELAAIIAYEEEGRSYYEITMDDITSIITKSHIRHDRGGDEHYDLLSALQKSIRGSDENAAIYYLARILVAGDLISACRRLLVIASEDIGLARPQAASIVQSCVDSAFQLGLPEARVPLALATVYLASSPKSNSAYMAINKAMLEIEGGAVYPIPRSLQNKHYDGDDVENKGQFYQYPHDSPNSWVRQQYLPDQLIDKIYYEPGGNKAELLVKEYWKKIKDE